MLKEFNIIKIILLFIIPYITLYAIYIQLNGEVSPGGGFQAGVIFATGIIAYDLASGREALENHFTTKSLTICGVLGVLVYAGTGLLSLIMGAEFLNYSALLKNDIAGQHLGIFMIELGVGLTVSSIMCLIYSLLREE
ncbi:MAG: Na(+)/H(+) antiporter subunit B [Rickettsiaceae bacterium]|jgi:multicomponent Na+:H+ antiporter subunit B|nr:Na(+)/H(+) antiporter subunit B [Rickettsiaceae bacterium]